MTVVQLDPQLEVVAHRYRTCEFSTLAKDGTPVTWPSEQYYQAEKGRLLLTTPELHCNP